MSLAGAAGPAEWRWVESTRRNNTLDSAGCGLFRKASTMTKHMGRLITGAGIATLVAGFAGYTGIEAAVDTGNLAVSASVAAKCTISDSTLAFGTYDPVVNNATTALDQVGTVDVACTKGSSAAVSLDLGTHASGSTRRMQHGVTATEFLAYELYTTAGRTTVWNTTNTVPYTATSKAPTTLTVYGRVPSGQDVATGSYTDTVVATITF